MSNTPSSPAVETPPETPIGPLRVIDFTHFIAGPFCTLILADLGADVIKVESTEGGDSFRSYPPIVDGQSAPYQWANRNKKSIQLDLKTDGGRQIALDLIDSADVVVENFSTGVMERLGLDYPAVSRRNPKIVYCSISAYGRRGPFAHRVGLDPILQAESGLMSMNGRPDDDAMRAGPAVVDVATGMMASNAILAALIARQRTGKGQLVETTMLGSAICLLANFSQSYLATGVNPNRYGNAQPTASPVDAFDTASGRIYLACANDRLFKRLASEVLNSPELAQEPRFATSESRRDNQQELHNLLQDRFRTASREVWLEKMHACGVPAGAIRTVQEALTSPEVKASGLLRSCPGGPGGIAVGLPMHFSATPAAEPAAAPRLGEQTHAVLSQLYDAERLSDLAAAGAFGA